MRGLFIAFLALVAAARSGWSDMPPPVQPGIPSIVLTCDGASALFEAWHSVVRAEKVVNIPEGCWVHPPIMLRAPLLGHPDRQLTRVGEVNGRQVVGYERWLGAAHIYLLVLLPE